MGHATIVETNPKKKHNHPRIGPIKRMVENLNSPVRVRRRVITSPSSPKVEVVTGYFEAVDV